MNGSSVIGNTEAAMIKYRKATKDDISVIIRLRVAFLVEHQGKNTQNRLEALQKNLFKYFEQRLGKNDFIAWLAFDGNEVVATSGLCFYSLPPTISNSSGKNAYIMNMYTVPKYRRKGIAKKLLVKIIEEAKSLGYKKMRLHSSESGESLYRQFGFIESKDTELVLNVDHQSNRDTT